jgi:hypothetical protein
LGFHLEESSMLEHLIQGSRVNLDYAHKLVADIPEENMCLQKVPGMNHAAWVLGHITYVFDSMVSVYGEKPSMSDDWKKLFNLASKPDADRSKYPSKQALLDAYHAAYERFVEVVKRASPELLAQEFPNPRLRPTLPTIGIAMVHVLTSHQGVHLGQLSAWRRAHGMPSVT